MPSSGGK